MSRYCQDSGLPEPVSQMVVQRLQQLPLIEAVISEGSFTEEEQPAARRHRPLKSGMHHTGATMVLKHLTWPYKVVYSTASQPASSIQGAVNSCLSSGIPYCDVR